MNYWNDRDYYPTGDEVIDPDDDDWLADSDDRYEERREDEMDRMDEK